MHVVVGVEVLRQVLLGVAPAVGAHHPDLAAADRLPQRLQHAQLVGDALHPALLVDDRVTPPGRDDPSSGTRSAGS